MYKRQLYEYGKDGYVFSKQKANIKLTDYHIAFADMLAEIQNYCEQRDVPFLFVFDPEKAAVYTDELHEGINYDNLSLIHICPVPYSRLWSVQCVPSI